MVKKSWLRYLVLIILLCVLIIVKDYISWRIKVDFERFKINFIQFIFIPLILNVLIGMILGADHLLNEIRKDGRFIINIPKLLLLGLPSLFLSCTYLYGYLGIEFLYKILAKLLIFGGNGITLFQIILGYTCITCLYKDSTINLTKILYKDIV